MNEGERNELIDLYFEALDAEEASIAKDALSDDFVYVSSAGVLEGFEGFRTYIDELRSSSNSVHDVTLRVHDEAGSVAEGVVTADSPDGPVEKQFCDVFEFDENEDRLTRVAVYLNAG